MSTPNDGGAAFPVPPERINAFPGGDTHWSYAHPGMTLRDYFAAKALQAIASQKTVHLSWEMIAERAYFAADLMLAERAKPKEAQP